VDGDGPPRTFARPERLFGLRPHPFGVALRAINFADAKLSNSACLCREFEPGTTS